MNLYKIDIIPVSLFTDIPSSYTIFGAICWAYRTIFGERELENLLNSFANNNPSFLISSILPRKDGTYYFPKPNLKAKRGNQELDYKKLKKISFIDLALFKKVLDGVIKNELDLNNEIEKNLHKIVSLTSKSSIPHAKIDRLHGTTKGSGDLFFESITTLNESFLLIAVKDNDIKKKLRIIFSFLQDIGLGGNRSVGYGRIIFGEFEPFNDLEQYFQNQNDKFVTLSPVIPEKDTYNFSDSYYDYFTFRGAIDNNYDFKKIDIWKDKVIYLKEGSTLKVKTRKEIYGQFYLAKEINGKKIYQYGLAFPLYIQGD
ncbi:type III-A CRISPR-associated RAMP protein Csm4 [Persephonella sp.]